MTNDNNSSIVSGPEKLSHDYIPSSLSAREKQIKELVFCISPTIKGGNPIHVWIYGKPGTGKTATCKFFLNKMDKEHNIPGLYINCWRNNSFFAILDKIVRELRILGAEKLNTSFKLERFQNYLKNRPFILLLDEIDKLPKKDKNNILYNFCNMGNLGIIAICNDRYVLYGLDKRVKSRLNPQQIKFPVYGEEDLLQILSRKAISSLAPGSYNSSILKEIVRVADGDIRVAIQTLKNAAYLAEKENTSSIEIEHVLKENNSTKKLKNNYILERLTVHHRIFYNLIKENKEILSGKLWEMYLKKCYSKKIKPVALRTYAKYLKKLIEVDLIKSERALVRGKVRKFRIAG